MKNHALSTPLRSGLAARLYIDLKFGSSISETLEEQASWWASNYHVGGDEASFKQKVTDYESGKYKNDQIFVIHAVLEYVTSDGDHHRGNTSPKKLYSSGELFAAGFDLT